MTVPTTRGAVDPNDVPVRHAATVLLVDDRPDLRALCLRRRDGSVFVGGMTVFPGGALDEADADPAYATRVQGLTEADADAQLGLDSGALAYWIAVARETFEEVGVLLARHRNGDAPGPNVLRQRHAVDDGSRSLFDVLVANDLVLDLGSVHDVGRWITPVGPPRRYDTRFFVARMPAGQSAEVDAVEAVHAEWRRPADALDDWARGELVMLPPTVCLLQVLRSFDDADALLTAAAAAQGPGRQARVRGVERGSFQVTLPGDPGYDDPAARPAPGWVYALQG